MSPFSTVYLLKIYFIIYKCVLTQIPSICHKKERIANKAIKNLKK